MVEFSLDDLIKKVDSKYTLVVLVAKRAREIVGGSKLLVDTNSKKPVTIAMQELASGKYSYERTKAGIK